MPLTLANADTIPDDLPPGTYCCRLDESSTFGDFKAQMVMPPQIHVPGSACCLIQLVKAGSEED